MMIAAALMLACLAGCGGEEKPVVVVYTALDEMFSRPILARFEEQTGIEVQPVYDTEASKTTGLVMRIINEAGRPRADVFWNNEIAQTIVLKQKELLEPYASPAAEAIPGPYKDPEHYWTGFAARGRVIIYNTDLVDEPPASILDYLDPKWKGRAAIAKPLFGTTATHAAALFALWGEDKAQTFFRDLLANDVAVLAGNATVRDMVASGAYAWGLTDTDDANGAVEDGLPARWQFPDQEQDGLGTLVIPNTVAVVKNAPHPEAARKLVDYLLEPDVERALAEMRGMQIPLNPAVDAPQNVPRMSEIRTMAVDFNVVAAQMESAAAFIRREFLK